MINYALFIETVTKLINDRLDSNKSKTISTETVERLFHFREMGQHTLTSLVKNLAYETRKFPELELDLNKDDELAVKQLVELGIVSFEWREQDTERNPRSDFATKYYQEKETDPITEAAADSLGDGQKWAGIDVAGEGAEDSGAIDSDSDSDGGEKVFSDFSSAFLRCLSDSAKNPGTDSTSPDPPPAARRHSSSGSSSRSGDGSSISNNISFPQHLHSFFSSRSRRVTEISELFVTFNIDAIALYKEFIELKVMPVVARYVINGLNLNCDLVSMPVKPCRRMECSEVWCQLRNYYENGNVTKKVLDFAEKSHLARNPSEASPTRIIVYFALDDTVDIENPWGSCPLLHNGSNFKTPEFSRYFAEFTDARNDDDNASNTCFIYAQKNPTIEIPSKLNTEADIVMRGAIRDADSLFNKNFVPRDESLAIAMALSHPKARVRNMALFFFSIYLPKNRSRSSRTSKCPNTSRITVGLDASLLAPERCPDERRQGGAVEEMEDKDATGSVILPSANQKKSISRKMSVASYRCLACRGPSNKCSEIDRFTRPVSMRSKQADSRSHLSHGGGMKLIDILLECSENELSKSLACAISPTPTVSQHSVQNCERGAVCHNFFCKGVQPVSTAFSSSINEKKKLVLYGKVVDVVNCSSATGTPNISGRRVFYNAEDSIKNIVPANYSEARGSFKDIVVHECDQNQVELHARENQLLMGSDHWWLSVVDLITEFDKHVEKFYTELAGLSQGDRFYQVKCKQLFREFSEKCKQYRLAKNALLSGEKGKGRLEAVDESEHDKEFSAQVERDVNEVVRTLSEYHARDDAATCALMHKSMFLGSRTVISGARCVVSSDPAWEFIIRQYVITMAGSAVAKVSDEDLANYTPIKGAVSTTTAPNDRLPIGAHRTWRDGLGNDMHGNVGVVHIPDSDPVKCSKWLDAERPLYTSFSALNDNRRAQSANATPSREKYVPPHIRSRKEQQQLEKWMVEQRISQNHLLARARGPYTTIFH